MLAGATTRATTTVGGPPDIGGPRRRAPRRTHTLCHTKQLSHTHASVAAQHFTFERLEALGAAMYRIRPRIAPRLCLGPRDGTIDRSPIVTKTWVLLFVSVGPVLLCGVIMAFPLCPLCLTWSYRLALRM